MRHGIQKITAVLLVILFITSSLAFSAAALEPYKAFIPDSGKTGDCTWTLDENGVLTISGNGAMADYQLKESFDPYRDTAPWGENITKLIIENGVTHIGSAAFGRCENLTNITIPDSVMTIGNYAFTECNGLTSVIIPEGVTQIDNSAFCLCHGLTSVTIPESVTQFGSYAFDNCDNLKSVYISDLAAWCDITFNNTYANPLSNGGDLYLNGEKISELEIPDGITKISDYAFTGGLTGSSCITSVTIPDSVTSIGDSAFYNCKNLAEINISDNVTIIGSYAFNNTAWYDGRPDGLLYLGNLAYQYKGKMPENTFVAIKDGTKRICEKAFYQCYGLTGVSIPDSVTFIGDSAFEFCKSLTSVDIPDSVTNIGYSAFKGCESLSDLTISDSLTYIRYNVFKDCKSLPGVIIPDSVTSIGSEAFSNCSALSSITVPDSVTNIGNRAFYGTAWFNDQEDGLVYAGKVAYTYKGEMPDDTSVVIKDGTLGIGDYAFEYRNGLASVTIPESIISMGYASFYRCSGLKRVVIKDLAAWCTIDFSGSNPLSSGLFYDDIDLYVNDKKITEPVIPDGVTSIAPSAFERCRTITSVTFPDSVTSIGNSAFLYCDNLTSAYIPESVTSIGEYAFSGCGDITIYGKANSCAAKYAAENQINFVALEEGIATGDTNYDGKITVSDVTEIQRHLADYINFSDKQLELADTDGNGVIDINDAAHLQKYIAGFEGVVLGKQ